MNRYNLLNQIISGSALVISLVLLINQNEAQKRISILDRAVRNLPGDVKAALAPAPKPAAVEVSKVPMTDPAFDDVHGTWFDAEILGETRPHIVISPNGFIAFGVERNVYWGWGELKPEGSKEWTLDATRFYESQQIKEMNLAGKIPYIRLKLEKDDKLVFSLESELGLTNHFANNGTVFTRWVIQPEK